LNGPVWWRVIAKRKREGEGWKISTPMIDVDVWHMIRRRAARLGLRAKDFGAHSLRSGAVTTYLKEGGALSDASSMVGHSKIDTTRQFYDHRGVPVEAVARLVGKSEPAR
jgi:integrase